MAWEAIALPDFGSHLCPCIVKEPELFKAGYLALIFFDNYQHRPDWLLCNVTFLLLCLGDFGTSLATLPTLIFCCFDFLHYQVNVKDFEKVSLVLSPFLTC